MFWLGFSVGLSVIPVLLAIYVVVIVRAVEK